jgi:MFS family permease
MKKWIAFTGLCLLAFTAFLDFTIVNTALPQIQESLKASLLELQWISNIFFLVTTCSFIFIGNCADRFSKKILLMWGSLVFALAALFAGFSTNINWLILFRGVQSFGAAGTFAIGVSMIGEIVGEKLFVRAAAVYTAVTGVGLALGPFLGGILVEFLSWHWVFWINLPIIVIGFLLFVPTTENIKPSDDVEPLNLWSLFFLILGLATFAYSLIDSQKDTLFNVKDITIFAIAVISIIVFITFEIKSKHPLIHKQLFTRPKLLVTMLLCIAAGGVTSVFTFFDPLYLVNIQDYSFFIAGLLLSVMPVAQVLTSVCMGLLLKAFKIDTLATFFVISVIVAATLHAFFTITTGVWLIVIAFLLLGLVWGMANTSCVIAVNEEMSLKQVGASIGALFTMWTMSSVVFLTFSMVVYKIFERLELHKFIGPGASHMSAKQLALLKEAVKDPAGLHKFIFAHPELKITMEKLFMHGFRSVFIFMAISFTVIFILSLIVYSYGRIKKL